MITTQLKMEDTCIICNVIETFWWKKMTKVEIWGPSSLFKLQMALAQRVKSHWHVCVSNQIFQLLKGRIDHWWLVAMTPLLSLNWIWGDKSLSFIRWGSKFARIRSTMTTLARVWIPCLVNRMSIHQREELNVVEGNACNCVSYIIGLWKGF
jgi:hypothetical protein